ncbi:MAG: ABC transporter ATP-binding protein, partial [Chitinivibrionia bacterium]|nr:ABC transporter ATP-binding protein [Chitinivibrionia bacterium]
MDYFHDDELQDRSYDSALMKRLLAYLRPYRKQVAASILLLLFVAVFQLAPPMLVKLAIDRYLNASAGLDASARHNGLVLISLVYGGVLLLGFAFSYLQIYIMSYI